MRLAILFRFHKDLDVCLDRLHLIRHLNPGVPIWGLYGGPRANAAAVQQRIEPLLDHFAAIESDDVGWKWLHQDLAVRDWFVKHGHRLAFDYLCDYEYDLLLATPFARLVPSTPNVVALTGLAKLSDVRSTWYWTSVDPHRRHFEQYVAHLAHRYGIAQPTYVSQGPFPFLPRAFLERLVDVEYPSCVIRKLPSEITYPAVAEAVGFDVIDTGFHPAWTSSIPGVPACCLFHCETAPLVTFTQIEAELCKHQGRRAFHPVKEKVPWLSVIARLASPDGV